MSDLRGYLSRGGKLLITTDSYNRTPNLDALLAEFGLSRTEGLVVEGDSSHSMNGYPTYLLPDYASAVESGVLDNVDKNRGVLLQMAQGIALTETEDVISEALLTTSAEAYSKTAGYEMTTLTQEDGDPDGRSRWRPTPAMRTPKRKSSGSTAAIWITKASIRCCPAT